MYFDYVEGLMDVCLFSLQWCQQRLHSFILIWWSEARTRGRSSCGTTAVTNAPLCRERPSPPRLTRYTHTHTHRLILLVCIHTVLSLLCVCLQHPVYCVNVLGTQNAHNLISISTDGKMCSWSLDMLSTPQVHHSHDTCASLDIIAQLNAYRPFKLCVTCFHLFPLLLYTKRFMYFLSERSRNSTVAILSSADDFHQFHYLLF